MERCIVTREELRRVSQFLHSYDPRTVLERACATRLETRLAGALVVEARELPRSVITMYSVARVVDRDRLEALRYAVVYPPHTDDGGSQVSLLSPRGCALFGASEGESIALEEHGRTVRLTIKEVLYQPEWDQRNRFSHGAHRLLEHSADAINIHQVRRGRP
jgi:hypothetical protein